MRCSEIELTRLADHKLFIKNSNKDVVPPQIDQKEHKAVLSTTEVSKDQKPNPKRPTFIEQLISDGENLVFKPELFELKQIPEKKAEIDSLLKCVSKEKIKFYRNGRQAFNSAYLECFRFYAELRNASAS